jgi:hypothetical protein
MAHRSAPALGSCKGKTSHEPPQPQTPVTTCNAEVCEKAHRHPSACDVETREEIALRWLFSQPYTPYFSGEATLRSVKPLWSSLPLTFHQASSDLDEQHGRIGIAWGCERSFDVLGVLRKVRWQHKVYKLIVTSLGILCSQYRVYKPNVSPL